MTKSTPPQTPTDPTLTRPPDRSAAPFHPHDFRKTLKREGRIATRLISASRPGQRTRTLDSFPLTFNFLLLHFSTCTMSSPHGGQRHHRSRRPSDRLGPAVGDLRQDHRGEGL